MFSFVENPDLVCQETGNSQSLTYPRPAECDSKLSRLGPTIQTEWSLHPEVFQAKCYRWHQSQVDLFATRFNNKLPQFVSPVPIPRPGQWMHSVLGRSGPICLPTSSHFGQRSEVSGLSMDYTRVAQHALVLYLNIQPTTILFGNLENEFDLFSKNLILLVAKKFICTQLNKSKPLNVLDFKYCMKNIYDEQE